MNCFFLDFFSFNIFRLWLIAGNYTQKAKPQIRLLQSCGTKPTFLFWKGRIEFNYQPSMGKWCRGMVISITQIRDRNGNELSAFLKALSKMSSSTQNLLNFSCSPFNFIIINFLPFFDIDLKEQASPFLDCTFKYGNARITDFTKGMDRTLSFISQYLSPQCHLCSIPLGCCEPEVYVTSYRKCLYKTLIGDSSDDKQSSVCQANISKASAFHWLLFLSRSPSGLHLALQALSGDGSRCAQQGAVKLSDFSCLIHTVVSIFLLIQSHEQPTYARHQLGRDDPKQLCTH